MAQLRAPLRGSRRTRAPPGGSAFRGWSTRGGASSPTPRTSGSQRLGARAPGGRATEAARPRERPRRRGGGRGRRRDAGARRNWASGIASRHVIEGAVPRAARAGEIGRSAVPRRRPRLHVRESRRTSRLTQGRQRLRTPRGGRAAGRLLRLVLGEAETGTLGLQLLDEALAAIGSQRPRSRLCPRPRDSGSEGASPRPGDTARVDPRLDRDTGLAELAAADAGEAASLGSRAGLLGVPTRSPLEVRGHAGGILVGVPPARAPGARSTRTSRRRAPARASSGAAGGRCRTSPRARASPSADRLLGEARVRPVRDARRVQGHGADLDPRRDPKFPET